MAEAGDNQSMFDELTKTHNLLSCSVVTTLDFSEQCDYVTTAQDCIDEKFYVNYIQLYYCVFAPRTQLGVALCTIALLSLCSIAFVILGSTADKFFCPALKVLSKEMGMSEHMAGVTLLAFGNGSPDLCTTFAGLDEDQKSQFSDLIGAAMFVCAFVSGVMLFICPFELQANSMFRDVCFMIFGILYINYTIVNDGYVTVGESSCILIIYFLYIMVICVDQFLLKLRVKDMEHTVRTSRTVSAAEMTQLSMLKSEAEVSIIARQTKVTVDTEYTRKMTYVASGAQNHRLIEQFLDDVNPFDIESWNSGGYLVKFLVLCRVVPNFLLVSCIPITDYEEERHGWSKLLNTLQCVITPFMFVLLTNYDVFIFGIPACILSLLLSVPFAIFVFLTTRTDLPPRYHVVFAIYSCVGAIWVIYATASECVEMLYVLGLVTNCSNAFLGCSLLAWGNSVGDLVADIALALGGYTKMAFAACIGGPFFNCLLGMGVVFLYKSMNSPSQRAEVTLGPFAENCFIFVMLFHVGMLLWMLTTNFLGRRSAGVFNMLLYVVFIVYLFLNETELVQSFASPDQAGA